MRAETAPAARRYREVTKHTPASVAASAHRLVWENKPTLYREYAGAETVSLPAPTALAGPVMELLAGGRPVGASPARLDLPLLSAVLFASGGVTGERPGGRGDIRATASAGALYPNEMYVVNGALPGLPAGVYHYDPKRGRLSGLRDGDWRGTLAAAAADERVGRAPATLVLTGILWRSAWKYRERAYRHLYWDGGMKVAHALAAAEAAGLPAAALAAFVDRDVDRLVGADGRQEAAIALLVLGSGDEPAPRPAEMGEIPFRRNPLSPHPIDYPEALRYHAAAALDDAAAVQRSRAPVAVARRRRDRSPQAIVALPEPAHSTASLDEVIRRRRSTRHFARKAIPAAELAAILASSATATPLDAGGAERSMLETYVIVHAVEGIAPGAYHYDRERRALELISAGDFRDVAGFLSLRQALARDASAVVYYLSDLDGVAAAFGERGYRLAELEAGRAAAGAYLAAYALGRGATGLTFFDDEVVRFFSPHAADLEPLLVVAVGVPARAARGSHLNSPSN